MMTRDRELRGQLFDGRTAGGGSTRETSNVKDQEDATRWRNTQQHVHTLRMSETPIELEVGSFPKTKKLDRVVLKLCLLCSHGNEADVSVLVTGNWSRAT